MQYGHQYVAYCQDGGPKQCAASLIKRAITHQQLMLAVLTSSLEVAMLVRWLRGSAQPATDMSLRGTVRAMNPEKLTK